MNVRLYGRGLERNDITHDFGDSDYTLVVCLDSWMNYLPFTTIIFVFMC